jgi:hypothetical protein
VLDTRLPFDLARQLDEELARQHHHRALVRDAERLEFDRLGLARLGRVGETLGAVHAQRVQSGPQRVPALPVVLRQRGELRLHLCHLALNLLARGQIAAGHADQPARGRQPDAGEHRALGRLLRRLLRPGEVDGPLALAERA